MSKTGAERSGKNGSGFSLWHLYNNPAVYEAVGVLEKNQSEARTLVGIDIQGLKHMTSRITLGHLKTEIPVNKS